MRLSASLIVRDEAANLDDCLNCLHPVVDEIIVVDTGSNDNTPDIARRHGAIVSRHQIWTDPDRRGSQEATDHG